MPHPSFDLMLCKLLTISYDHHLTLLFASWKLARGLTSVDGVDPQAPESDIPARLLEQKRATSRQLWGWRHRGPQSVSATAMRRATWSGLPKSEKAASDDGESFSVLIVERR